MSFLGKMAASVSQREGGEMHLGMVAERPSTSPRPGGSTQRAGSSRAASPRPAASPPRSQQSYVSHSPRPLAHSDGSLDDYKWAQETQAMLKTVQALPPKGNPMSFLCQATRDVLDAHDMLLEDHSPNKVVRWTEALYRGGLKTDVKVDSNKTTLGLVLQDDAVELVLPGGPAFNAGIKKGDCILTVSVF
jgi:hypothetical protein